MTLSLLKRRIPPAVALLVFLGSLVAGCAPTKINTRYKPLHPANNTAVEFGIKAGDGDGISKVELFVYEYELYVSSTNMMSARKRNGGVWGLVKQWTYPSKPTSVDEKYSVAGFPAGSFITYIVRTTDGRNNRTTESWSFAAGSWPFGNSPIPIWGNGAPAERIDVAFVADRDDYSTARDMLGDLEQLIFDGYHTNNGVKLGKKYWQFYYSPERGHISDYNAGPPYTLDIPASVSGSTIIDHAAVIHTTVKRDWASGGNFGTEPNNRGTAVHESGHAAFNLADEYAGGGHFSSSSPHHNIYGSKTDCENYNTSRGFPASDCEQIGSTTWWRSEPSADACIMFNDGDATMPDFEHTCILRAIWFYNQLEGTP